MASLLIEDWDRVQQVGIASWELIHHRLKEAGVKPAEYKTEYFVPCLLEVESKGPFAAVDLVASRSMSLIILSHKIEFIPEQLHLG